MISKNLRQKILTAVLVVPLTAALGGAWTDAQAGGAKRLSSATIAARQHYFGLDNVDPKSGAVRKDRVIISWTGVSSFAAAFKGNVILLDTYIARDGGALGGGLGIWPGIRYVGSTPEELAALKPDLVLFGHSHFDHMGDLPTVVRANPEALIAGTEEHCNDIRAEVTDVGFDCLSVFEAGADFGSMTDLPKNLLPGVEITAIKQPHSSGPPDPAADPPFPWRVEGCSAFEGLAFDQYPVQPDEPLAWGAPGVGPPSGSISIAWQIRVGHFALVWQDTAGPIAGTGVPHAFASLPETDVRLASIVVAGRSVLTEHNAILLPKLFIPIHHDACGYFARKEVEEHIAALPDHERPTMRFLSDPSDYLRPIVFDPKAKIWR